MSRRADHIASQNDSLRRKRLGQFFSGDRLGRLLAQLCRVSEAKTLIDPMVGSGDILAAGASLMAPSATLAGIEIDGEVAERCAARLNGAQIVNGSAFSPRSIVALPKQAWERVLTNPPFVRYQSQAGSTFQIPSSIDVRTDLLTALSHCPALDAEDLRIFREIAARYSGLSDLAVPSVILCAALTAPDGVLGLVMPEAWLSRDYAAPIHYILSRWFQVEVVVEDAHASWFEDALVKTTIVVARRIQRRQSALDSSSKRAYPHIRLSAAAMDSSSLVSRLYPQVPNPEEALAREISAWREGETVATSAFLEVNWIDATHQARGIASSMAHVAWLKTLEPIRVQSASGRSRVPVELSNWLDASSASGDFVPLSTLGVSVGQGLRTGANGFFYAPIAQRDEGTILLGPLPLLGGRKIRVDSRYAVPALRRQAELPLGFAIFSELASSAVIDIDSDVAGHVESNSSAGSEQQIACPELMELIRAAERRNFGTEANPKKVWELSAVSTNCRKAKTASDKPECWYMLPAFVDRHRPDVFVPRVNSRLPQAYLNVDRGTLIDANFSTLWIAPQSKLDSFGLLAVMNSTWAQVAMELSASVLGGGAAKLEASHIRSVPMPSKLAVGSDVLSTLGRDLAFTSVVDSEGIRQKIDGEVLTLILGREPADEIHSLRRLGHLALRRRSSIGG